MKSWITFYREQSQNLFLKFELIDPLVLLFVPFFQCTIKIEFSFFRTKFYSDNLSSIPESWRSSSSNLNFTSGMLAIHSHCTHLKSTSTALFCFVLLFLLASLNDFLISGPLRAILCSRRPTYRVSMVFWKFWHRASLLILLDFSMQTGQYM